MKILDNSYLGITLISNLFVISLLTDIIFKFAVLNAMGLKIRVRPGPVLEGKNHD
jgi:hypothetical protein